jgi:large subunit ribosomal protein L15
MLIYAPDHFGRHGFKRPPEIVARPTSLNVGELEGFVPALEAAEALSREGATFVADLAKAGVDRLLGGGAPTRSWKVFVAHASKHAREKVTVLDQPPGASAPASAESVP